jgi:hypothetical protein
MGAIRDTRQVVMPAKTSSASVPAKAPPLVVPAKAGTHLLLLHTQVQKRKWIPVFAGMTKWGRMMKR